MMCVISFSQIFAELHFTLCEPNPTQYEWLCEDEKDDRFAFVCPVGKPEMIFRMGSQLIVHTQKAMSEKEARAMFSDSDCRWVRQFLPKIQIYELPNARQCLKQAEHLAAHDAIEAAYPVRQAPLRRLRPYAPFPNDPYFSRQWYLENRDSQTAVPLGVDLAIRGAWHFSKGQGVTIAVADDGVELDHPDLSAASDSDFHFNFSNQTRNGSHGAFFQAHGTAVAGLALARNGNKLGMSGVAPEAKLASWVIFDSDDLIVDALLLSEMFLFENDSVAIQNHSWGNGLAFQLAPSLIEQIAISNAVYHSRGGRGVVMIRAGGNSREAGFTHPGSGDSNDDGYTSNPAVIAVAAVDDRGRAATYSNPGSSLLLAAPGGEDGRSLFTTDRIGRLGFNASSSRDLSNYAFGSSGFVGTSASTPLISGIVALILSVNPELSVRDVQQILLLSCKHFDLDDPNLAANGAGILVSHNVGYGIPNAAKALDLAKDWSPRPSLIRKSYSIQGRILIPDDALHVAISGNDIPADLRRIPASPSQGPVPDHPTASLPLISIGQAISNIDSNLSSSGALIQRGENLFREKIDVAAAAGAEFAIIFNNRDADARVRMGGTFYTSIPAVFIGQNLGERLRDATFADPSLQARLALDAAEFAISVEDSILCEHIGLRVKTNHSRRGDLRITLISPSGTRSILQAISGDNTRGPADWTYYSTHHFYEQAAGIWTVGISDSESENTGEVLEIELILYGVAMDDSDRDGLDDAWEMRFFGNLFENQSADSDEDGKSNLIEYLLDTNPISNDVKLKVDFSIWNERLGRVSWNSVAGRRYEIRKTDLQTNSLIETIIGEDFESEFFPTISENPIEFYKITESTD